MSKILRDEIEIEDTILSEKKKVHHVSFYSEKLHHYDYQIARIFEKLKRLVPKACLKSKKKSETSSNEILKFVT